MSEDALPEPLASWRDALFYFSIFFSATLVGVLALSLTFP